MAGDSGVSGKSLTHLMYLTDCGEILVSLNPYHDLGIHDEKHQKDYSEEFGTKKLPPHIFNLSERAFQNMLESQTNQAIIVSGESGAGKTESTKYILQQVMYSSKGDTKDLQEKIIKANIVLEAFGNAMTSINQNSSRFGKFTEIRFDNNGELIGAIIRDYMLEKSRLIQQNPGEGNFHIFYAFFAGASVGNYNLTRLIDYRILKKTNSILISDTKRFKDMYNDILNTFRILEFTNEDIETVEKILAVILHLTEVQFIPNENTEGVYIYENKPIENVANLLELDTEQLAMALIIKTLKLPNETLNTVKDKRQAEEGRDALAKSLYERLFGWIVKKINQALMSQQRTGQECSLGILDMSGFENIRNNNFEQLCINSINEKLQNYLDNHIFTKEKQLYASEGIDSHIKEIQYQGNEDIITLLMKRPVGLMSIINEETHLPDTNYKTLVRKMDKYLRDNDRYECSEALNGDFAIRHFAGKVLYNTYSYLEKNKDELSDDIIKCLQNSSDDFIGDIFTIPRDLTGTISNIPFNIRKSKKVLRKRISELNIVDLTQSMTENALKSKKKAQNHPTKTSSKTVINYLLESLKSLVKILDASELHFVRCIKPNSYGVAFQFDSEKVRQQLLYTGIVEAAEICKSGYPYRRKFSEFIDRYSVLVKHETSFDEEEQVRHILQLMNICETEYCLGRHMVFMKDGSFLLLKQRLKSHEKQEELKQVELKKRKIAEMKIETSGPSLTIRNRSTKKKIQFAGIGQSDKSSSVYSLQDITSPLGLKNFTEPFRIEESVCETPNDQTVEENETIEDKEEPWDMFEMVPDEIPESTRQQFTGVFSVIKILLYVFLFSTVLATSIIQKLSFSVLIQKYRFEILVGNTSEMFPFMLIAICIPYGIAFFISCGRFAFRVKTLPTFKILIMFLVPEMLHTAGITLLVFHVLPKMEMVSGILLMNATAFWPSLMRTISSGIDKDTLPNNNTSISSNNSPEGDHSGIHTKPWKRPLITFLDLFSTILQLGGIITFVYFMEASKLKAAIGLALVSIPLWENFYDKCCFSKTLDDAVKKYKTELEVGKNFMYIVVYFLKIVFTILLAYFYPLHDSSVSLVLNPPSEDVMPYLAVILLTICCPCGYYFAFLACKLCMQRISFSLPLFLSTPATVGILVGLVMSENLKILSNNDVYPGFNKDFFSHAENTKVILWTWVNGLCLYLSFQWIVRHIWNSNQIRLMTHEFLFQNVCYCSFLFEQEILLTRTRKNYTPKSLKTNNKSQNQRVQMMEMPSLPVPIEKKSDKIYPKIYACATMWHETKNEMMQIVKSILRMSLEHRILKDMKDVGDNDEDYFEFEAHIFFDDAMTTDENGDMTINKFVEYFISVIDDAVSSVMKTPTKMHAPIKLNTPYGGQLLWTLMDDVELFVHLKDKTRIRHRKRWSQVMYMYYLLGHRLTSTTTAHLLEKMEGDNINMVTDEKVSEMLNKEIDKMAEQTFILALDGDVDFRPDSVERLVDLMQSNPHVGAACGRIHPIGSGPLIWFQKFEYAVGHWFQKAAEHILGCVLCSPGCFSLFRGSALMATNVMRKYTSLATEPKHYLQYDQGEDRWLCTLLLQQGYRIEYCAAADAYTYAPEGFEEFYNQRRRWMPSTMANIIDLLGSYKLTVERNDNISTLYILYQLVLLFSTVLGPATVMIILAVSLTSVLFVDIYISYLLIIIPSSLYTVSCFYTSSKTQLILASIQTVIYSFIMVAVIVNIVIDAAKTSVLNPGVIIITITVIMFLIAGVLHPQEFTCLLHGFIYFLGIPSGYLILVIYSMCNMHVVSWGTREVKQVLTVEEMEKANEEKLKGEMKKTFSFSKLFLSSKFTELLNMFTNMSNNNKKHNDVLLALAEINTNLKKLLIAKNIEPETTENVQKPQRQQHQQSLKPFSNLKHSYHQPDSDSESIDDDKEASVKKEQSFKGWLHQPKLGEGAIVCLSEEEEKFWNRLISKYLSPLNLDEKEQKKAKEDLITFRDNTCFAMIMLNILWLTVNFMFQYRKPWSIALDKSNETERIEVFSLVFMVVFAIIFIIQFLSLLAHRLETFWHLISATNIIFRAKEERNEGISKEFQYNILRKLRYEPENDYYEDDTSNKYEITFTQKARTFVKESISTQQISLRKTIHTKHGHSKLQDSKFEEQYGALAGSTKYMTGIPEYPSYQRSILKTRYSARKQLMTNFQRSLKRKGIHMCQPRIPENGEFQYGHSFEA